MVTGCHIKFQMKLLMGILEKRKAYYCIIVCLVLNDKLFSDDFSRVIENYDFHKMDGRESSNNFKTLLEEWQNLQSTIISIAVSVAKYRIALLKKDSEIFLQSSIPEKYVTLQFLLKLLIEATLQVFFLQLMSLIWKKLKF